MEKSNQGGVYTATQQTSEHTRPINLTRHFITKATTNHISNPILWDGGSGTVVYAQTKNALSEQSTEVIVWASLGL